MSDDRKTIPGDEYRGMATAPFARLDARSGNRILGMNSDVYRKIAESPENADRMLATFGLDLNWDQASKEDLDATANVLGKLLKADNGVLSLMQTPKEHEALNKIVPMLAGLSDKEKTKTLHFLNQENARRRRRIEEERRGQRRKIAELDRRISELTHEEAELVRMRDAWAEFEAWNAAGLVLGRPHGSMFHKFLDDARNKMLAGHWDLSDRELAGFIATPGHVFLVEHDWASALRNAPEFGEGSIAMPYDYNVFELHVSGKRVIGYVVDAPEDGEHLTCAILVHTTHGWMLPIAYVHDGRSWKFDESRRHKITEAGRFEEIRAAFAPIAKIVTDQVTAVVVALEAEIAVHEVVRAPHKLNRARERSGRLPAFDHHVINLARRSRAARLPDGERADDEKRRSPRFHFRRGHDRHYPNYKIRIPWTVIGDPDLGSIETSYRL